MPVMLPCWYSVPFASFCTLMPPATHLSLSPNTGRCNPLVLCLCSEVTLGCLVIQDVYGKDPLHIMKEPLKLFTFSPGAIYGIVFHQLLNCPLPTLCVRTVVGVF